MSKNDPKVVLTNARAYIKGYFEVKKLSISEAKKRKELLSSVILDHHDLVQAYNSHKKNKLRNLADKTIEHALNEYLEVAAQEERDKATDLLRCNKENLNPVEAWLKAVTGQVLPLDVQVVAHWLWQVKRKSYSMSVVHHVMPVLFGEQGGGKTFALNALIKPLQLFQLDMKMDQLGDERIYSAFGENLIVFFDELQNIERTDLNTLKHQITTNINSYRRLHSHMVITAPMRCSFIGATNKRLNENFSDSTGMRRFYELIALPKADWNTINAIDYTALWKGIDEKLERGYLNEAALVTLKTKQEEYTDEDDVDAFIKEHGLRIANPNKAGLVSKMVVYNAYRAWTAANGIKYTLNSQWFTKKMKGRHIETVDNKDGKFFKVDANCILSGEVTRMLKGVV